MNIDSNFDFHALPRPMLLLFSHTLFAAPAQYASGETIHHWRFESGAFLVDSVGNAHLTNTTVTQTGLSEVDPEAAFPVPIGSASNLSAAEFHDTGGLGGEITALVSSWTIEMLVRTETLNGVWGQALFNNSVSRCNSSGNIGIQFRRDGTGGTTSGELAIFSGSTFSGQIWIPLGFVPDIGKDYYLGFVHDDQRNTLTFYVQNLTDRAPLTRSQFAFEAYSFPDATDVEIGNVSGGACGADSHAHEGLIDEVRVSDAALSMAELYVSDLVFADGFEPVF